jgi:hypothetical protein
MSKPRENRDLSAVIREVVFFVVVSDLAIVLLDWLLFQYVDLSFVWSWLPNSSVIGSYSTLFFLEGGILAAIGAFIGGGVAESQAVSSLPSGGVTTGPELQGKLAKERMQMRDEQLGFGLKLLMVGFSLVVLSVAIALL